MLTKENLLIQVTEEAKHIRFRIWSQEHGAWWAPNKNGYTRDYLSCGKYSMEDAMDIVREANKHLEPGEVNEIALLVIAVA